jgi:hypothetical protein
MDEPLSLERRAGGTVEPLNRAAIAKGLFQTPRESPAERFELRDPFAEVTHRVKTLQEMVSKAERAGAVRFTAISADGKRSYVSKINNHWTRIPQEPTVRREPHAQEVVMQSSNPARPDSQVAATTAIDPDAERLQLVSRLEASLSERYLIKRAAIRIGELRIGQTEYRHRGDPSRIAFTESAFRLSTDNDSPSVARSMIDVAEARNWQGLRVSGSDDFKRLVWLEASARGVRTVGYEPVTGDLELLRKTQEARNLNRIDRSNSTAATGSDTATKKESSRGGGRKTVLAAIEAILVAKRVPEAQRQAVMRVATEQLAARVRAGQVHRVKVYDKAAPRPERVSQQRAKERQPNRERAAPAR